MNQRPTICLHPIRRAMALLAAFALVLSTIAWTTAGLTNSNGATVEGLSSEIDSSNPGTTNPAGATVIFATTDQFSADLVNPEYTAGAWVGLFDPLSTWITRNAAHNWDLYN